MKMVVNFKIFLSKYFDPISISSLMDILPNLSNLSNFNNIPDEIIIHVMGFLDIRSLYRFGACSKQFFILFISNEVWKSRLINDYPWLENPSGICVPSIYRSPWTKDNIERDDYLALMTYIVCYKKVKEQIKKINEHVSSKEADIDLLAFPNGGGYIRLSYASGPPYETAHIKCCGSDRIILEIITVHNLKFSGGNGFKIEDKIMMKDEANQFLRQNNYREFDHSGPPLSFNCLDHEFGLQIGLFK